MRRCCVLARVLGVYWVVSSLAIAQEAQAPRAQEPQAKTEAKQRPAKRLQHGSAKSYMGRPIADVMSFEGADWLFRASREVEERPEEMLDALQIKPGDTVADVGAGAGYTSLRLAKRVGPSGKVLATDLQPQMLQMLTANARAAGVKNVRAIQCTPTDPKLPSGQVDLVLMVDVYHECSHPKTTLQGLRKALKPGGRMVLVEFRAEDPDVPIKPEHKMALAQVRKEIEPEGFVFKESLEFLPWQHIIIFERPADEASKPQDPPKPTTEK